MRYPGVITCGELLKKGEEILVQAGVPEADLNAWYLFSYCFQMERSSFFLRREEAVGEEKRLEYEGLLEKRAKRIPLEHITKETQFMGLPFFVDESVLIPRQDTECLVEEVLRVSDSADVLDLCTGSGCIGISLAVLGKCRTVTLADISKEALVTARINAKKNHVTPQIVQGDLFENIKNTYDIIVSNPPYIKSGEIAKLMPEVRDHDPYLALNGEEDGLKFYRRIAAECLPFLKRDGKLFFEIGYDQAEDVMRIMKPFFKDLTVKKDLAGLDRIVMGTLKC